MKKFTPRQVRFIERYCVHLNQKQAAIEAGYKEKGSSRTGYGLMQNPRVRKEVEARLEARSNASDLQADDVKRRLCSEVEADLLDIFGDDGALLPLREWPKIWRQGLISSINTSTDIKGNPKISIKLSDRAKRIEMLGRHLKMFTDKVEGSVEHVAIKAEQEALAKARQQFTKQELERLNVMVMEQSIDVVKAVAQIEGDRQAH